jgi:hypothetical protein
MRRRTVLVLSVVTVLAALGGGIAVLRRPAVSAEDGKRPVLILYSEEDFQGPSLEVTGSLRDLPVETDPDGVQFDWNDRVRSVVVVSGTWRLFQHGRSNTKLDDTPLEALDLRTKEKETGWTCLLSATSAGPLELPSGAVGAFYQDVSSIELVSEENLPDWASPLLAGK